MYEDGVFGKGRLMDDKGNFIGDFSTLADAERKVCEAFKSVDCKGEKKAECEACKPEEGKGSGNAAWTQWRVIVPIDGEPERIGPTVKEVIVKSMENCTPISTAYPTSKIMAAIPSQALVPDNAAIAAAAADSSMSRDIPNKEKKITELLKKQGNKCASCIEELMGHFDVDHITPFATCNREKRVDVHDISNLQLLCLNCHRDKTNEEKKTAAKRRKIGNDIDCNNDSNTHDGGGDNNDTDSNDDKATVVLEIDDRNSSK